MKDKETIADELYYKISKYSDVQMYDAEGGDTSNVDEAVLFQINYGSETSPQIITFNIFDPEEMEMIFSKNLTDDMDNHEQEKWYKFVDDMRDFATTRMMGWKVHDITKSRFDKNDFDFIRNNTNYSHKDATMESRMYGSKRSSYTEQANTRLIVRHTKPIEEDKHGARSRNIKAIYIENANKERFLVPRNHMGTARALARHVANEGSISDDIGNAIVEMHDEMKALSKFTRKVRSTDNMMEGADRILEAAKSRYGKVKKTLEALQKQKGYSDFAEGFERQSLEEAGDFDTLRNTLTRHVYNEEFDDVLPYLNRALQEADDESFDKKSQASEGTAPITAWLQSGEPLKLFVHDDDEQLAMHRSSDTLQKVALVMSNIAQNVTPSLPDELFNFALNVSDTISNGMDFFGTPQEKQAKKADFNKKLKVAIEVVKRYLDDIKQMETNPGYKEEVRMERGSPKGKKVKESDLEMFENWVEGLTENALKDELIDASDAIMQYAYELGNTHMDYDTFIQAAELLDASNFDEMKDLFLGADTDVRDKMYELMLDAGPAISDMVEGWLDEPVEEPEMDDEMPADDMTDDLEAEPEMQEESLGDIARLAGVELSEHGEESYSDVAQGWASQEPEKWAELEKLMKHDMGADAISDHAFTHFKDMDEHDINDMVTAFCEQYGIDYDTDWDYDQGDFERDEVYADDEPRWMESAENITMEDDWDDNDAARHAGKPPLNQVQTADDITVTGDDGNEATVSFDYTMKPDGTGYPFSIVGWDVPEAAMYSSARMSDDMIQYMIEDKDYYYKEIMDQIADHIEWEASHANESVELEEGIMDKLKAAWTGFGEDEQAMYDKVKKVIYSIETPEQAKSARKFLRLAQEKWFSAMNSDADGTGWTRTQDENPKLFVNLDKLLDEIERRVSEEPQYSGDGVVGEDNSLDDMKKLAGL